MPSKKLVERLLIPQGSGGAVVWNTRAAAESAGFLIKELVEDRPGPEALGVMTNAVVGVVSKSAKGKGAGRTCA